MTRYEPQTSKVGATALPTVPQPLPKIFQNVKHKCKAATVYFYCIFVKNLGQLTIVFGVKGEKAFHNRLG